MDPVESWQGQSPSSRDIMIGIRYAKNHKIKNLKINNIDYSGDYQFDGEVLKLIKIKNSDSMRDGANFIEVNWDDGESFMTVVKTKTSSLQKML